MLPVYRNDIGQLLTQAAHMLESDLGERLKEMGITQGSYVILHVIDAADGPMNAPRIADALRLDHAGVSRSVTHMLQDGWLEEERHPDDPQQRILALAPKAKVIMPAILASGHWAMEEALNGFTGEEIDRLKDFLQRLVGNLSKREAV